MNFRPESSKNQRKQLEDDEPKGAAVAVAAVVGFAGLAAWGISKLIRGNTEEKPRSAALLRPIEQAYPQIQHIIPLKWTKPKPGFYKLNTDASVKGKDYGGQASGGGVIRDHTGEWMVGFTVKLGECDSVSAEMKSLRDGIRLAWDKGYRKIEVETDAQQVVNYITDPFYVKETHKYRSIIKECRELMGYGWDYFNISHVMNRQNKCADLLAEMAQYQTSPFIVFDDPPDDNVHKRVRLDQMNS